MNTHQTRGLCHEYVHYFIFGLLEVCGLRFFSKLCREIMKKGIYSSTSDLRDNSIYVHPYYAGITTIEHSYECLTILCTSMDSMVFKLQGHYVNTN